MISGHKKIEKLIAHAYLFFGPEGMGKFEAAMEFANRIGSNPFVLMPEVLEKNGIVKKKDIKVEKIRELIGKVSLTANDGKKMVAIIRDAQKLTRSSQNALLKTLEEPPRNCVIILVADDKNSLLPTVLSRCQKIPFNPLSDERISSLIGDGFENKEEIVLWSLGRPLWARQLMENPDELEARKIQIKELCGMRAKDISERFFLADSYSKNIPETIQKLGWWSVFLRRRIIGKSTSGYLSDMDVSKALAIEEEIEKSEALLRDTNANAKLILENLFLKV